MKKVICLLVVLVMALGSFGVSVSAAEYGTVLNNNVALMVGSTTAVAKNSLQTVAVAPTEIDGTVFIPLRSVAEMLNGTVVYDGAANTVDVSFGTEKTVVIRIGSTQYTMNGRAYDFPAAPQIINGSTMVPLKTFVEDILGQSLFYDAASRLIVISGRRVLKDAASDAAVISTITNAMNSGNLPTISVPTSYELDWGAVTGGVGGNYDVGQLKFVSVTASAEPEPANSANNLIDGSAGSFWAIGDVGGEAVCDLGKVNAITEIKVAFSKYNDRAANYDVLVSEDGRKYTSVFSGSSTQGQQWVSHNVNGAYRYVKIVANGNSTGGTWNSIAEVQAFNGNSGGGETTTVVAGAKLKASKVTASSEPEAENNGQNTVDGDVGTFWAAQGECNIVLDYGAAQTISSVGVRMRSYDDGRSINYGVDYSTDGTNYTAAFDGTCEPGGAVMETHDVNANARYIRVRVNGSTTNNWASVAEIEAYGAATTVTTTTGGTGTTASAGSKLTPAKVTASSEPEAENNAQNTIDGDAGTFWAAQGECYATFDLGSAKTVSSVGVRMRSYDDGRSVNYGVSYSTDGTSYTSAFDGTCEPGGAVMETHDVNASARYIRVSVNGSTTNNWASVAEVEIYGAGEAAAETTTATATDTATVQSVGSFTNLSTVSGEFVLAIQGTDSVLTVGSDNFTLNASAYTGSASQIWTKDGSTLKNKGTGFCLDVANQSYDEGGQICVWEGNGGDNQNWELESGSGFYYVKSGMSGFYLSYIESSVQQRSKDLATKWVIASASAAAATTTATVTTTTASTGSFTNLSTVSGEFVLAVQGSDKVLTVNSDNFSLTTAACTRSSAQLWTKDGSSLKNKGNGFCLDVAEESLNDGAQICVWESNGGNNQSWTLEKQGDYYYVKSNLSGLYLTAVGTGVQQKGKSSATKWVISK